MSRFLRPGWIMVYILAIVGCVWFGLSGAPDVHFEKALVIKEGDTLTSILANQGRVSSWRIRRVAEDYGFNPSMLKVGSYADLSGDVAPKDFYKALVRGPRSLYQKVRILESWSIYDTDAYLTKKNYIKAGEYIAYVTDPSNIRQARSKYSFLEILPDDIDSLEGFLYPDTYHIDPKDPVLPQLMKLQLKGFYDKIWLQWGNDILTRKRWKPYGISPYELLIMASVVLREDGKTSHQPKIAGVFLNRLKKNMRLGSDITLCYGLKKPSSYCSERMIVKHLNDKKNPYNTRALVGLPPTPISSLTPGVIRSVVNVDLHDDVYFLIGKQGKLHTGKTLQDHQYNKKTYMQ